MKQIYKSLLISMFVLSILISSAFAAGSGGGSGGGNSDVIALHRPYSAILGDFHEVWTPISTSYGELYNYSFYIPVTAYVSVIMTGKIVTGSSSEIPELAIVPDSNSVPDWSYQFNGPFMLSGVYKLNPGFHKIYLTGTRLGNDPYIYTLWTTININEVGSTNYYTWVQDTLNPGESLYKGTYITSQNGNYKFILQNDGNLVLYRTVDNKPLWATNTKTANRATMQTDGNFVLYGINNKPIWASNTNGNPSSYLTVQNDGNVVIYNSANRPIWETKTK